MTLPEDCYARLDSRQMRESATCNSRLDDFYTSEAFGSTAERREMSVHIWECVVVCLAYKLERREKCRSVTF